MALRFKSSRLKHGVAFAALALLVLASISYIPPLRRSDTGVMDTGKYYLASLQNGETTVYEGSVYFEFGRQRSEFRPEPVFKLHFINPDNKAGSSFGFLIRLQEDAGEAIAADRYRVHADPDEISDSAESVFGYADVLQQEASLYFAESGSLSIDRSTQTEVSGNMHMTLKDETGQSMELRGRFSARPLY